MADQAPVRQGDTTAGPGGAAPLPYGEATTLNQDLAAVPQAPPAGEQPPSEAAPSENVPAEPQTPSGTEATVADLGSAEAPTPVFNPSTDEEKYLFGPTVNPNEPVTAGLLASGNAAPPPDIKEWLPAIRAAAADPTAPESTRLILAFVANEMG